MGTFHGWPAVAFEAMLALLSGMLVASLVVYFSDASKYLPLKADDASQKLALLASGAVPYVELPAPVPGGNVKIGTCQEVFAKSSISVGRMLAGFVMLGKAIKDIIELRRAKELLKQGENFEKNADEIIETAEKLKKNANEIAQTAEKEAEEAANDAAKQELKNIEKQANELSKSAENLKNKAENYKKALEKLRKEASSGRVDEKTLEEVKKAKQEYEAALEELKKNYDELMGGFEGLTKKGEELAESVEKMKVLDPNVFGNIKAQNGPKINSYLKKELGGKAYDDYDIFLKIDDEGKLKFELTAKKGGENVYSKEFEIVPAGKEEDVFFKKGNSWYIKVEGLGDLKVNRKLKDSVETIKESIKQIEKDLDSMWKVTEKTLSIESDIARSIDKASELSKEINILRKWTVARLALGGYLIYRRNVPPVIKSAWKFISSKFGKYNNFISKLVNENSAFKVYITVNNLVFGEHYVTPFLPNAVIFHRLGKDFDEKVKERAKEFQEVLGEVKEELYSDMKDYRCFECIANFKELRDEDFISTDGFKASFYPFYLAELARAKFDGKIDKNEASLLKEMLETHEVPTSSHYYSYYAELNEKVKALGEVLEEAVSLSNNYSKIAGITFSTDLMVYMPGKSYCFILFVPKENPRVLIPVLRLPEADCYFLNQATGFYKGVNDKIENSLWSCLTASDRKVAICYEAGIYSECRVVEFYKPVVLNFEPDIAVRVEDKGDYIYIHGNFRRW